MSSCQPSEVPYYGKGCSTSECCDSSGSCSPNVRGPCVCFTYGEDPTGGGWNYTFIATCSGNHVSTTWGISCYAMAGAAYTCYCRPKTSTDRGVEADRIAGNWILSPNDDCRSIPGTASGTSTTRKVSGTSGTSSAVSATTSGSGLPEEMSSSLSFALLLILLTLLGF